VATILKAFAVVALSVLGSMVGDAPAPTAAFSVSTVSPAVQSAVRFTDGYPGDRASWFWDFGDGAVSTSRDPVHAYSYPGNYPVTLTVTTAGGSATASRLVTVTASDTLRLMSSHPFDITLSATDPRTGNTGQGQVLAQNDIYGIFSIPAITGNAGNPEVIIKMVDATGIGQSYWVFYGALTDLTYTLSVKEDATGLTKTYNDAKVGTTVCGKFDTSGFGASSIGLEPAGWSDVSSPGRAAASDASTTLRLLSAHPFDITLSATDPRTGNNGQGQVIAQNDIYGIFSIPAITGNASNPEVIIKMVDASGIGQNYWVFYAALTDLTYTLSVQESATGTTKNFNDAKVGTTVCGKFDTSGFAAAGPTPTPTVPQPAPTPTPTPPSSATHIVNVAQDGTHTFRDAVSGSSSTTVRVGDTVQWKFLYDMHSATSGSCKDTGGYYDTGGCTADGFFDSGVLTAPATYSWKATSAGVYPYFCQVHLGLMTGTITVNP
jgi:PKD repeat protein